MAAPQFIPVSPTERIKAYESNDHVPKTWQPGRPGELDGRQPAGDGLGSQGPDQGFGIKLANSFAGRLHLTEGESSADALRGGLNVGLKRASLFGRAPVIHDFTVAFTLLGFLDGSAPADLVARRKAMFEGIANTNHHYSEGRAVADSIPESTLRRTPAEVTTAYIADWRTQLGW
jgi:hypothetical protein